MEDDSEAFEIIKSPEVQNDNCHRHTINNNPQTPLTTRQTAPRPNTSTNQIPTNVVAAEDEDDQASCKIGLKVQMLKLKVKCKGNYYSINLIFLINNNQDRKYILNKN